MQLGLVGADKRRGMMDGRSLGSGSARVPFCPLATIRVAWGFYSMQGWLGRRRRTGVGGFIHHAASTSRSIDIDIT